jgi:hypothetical protein
MTATAPFVPSDSPGSLTGVPVVARQPRRGYVVAGLAAAVVAAAAVTLLAAAAMAAGVDFELPDGGDSIPLLGFTQITLMFSVVGLVVAAALRRWSRRPAATFVRVAVALTAISLVPPFLYDANVATSLTLVVLHLTAAAIVIPVVGRRLAD